MITVLLINTCFYVMKTRVIQLDASLYFVCLHLKTSFSYTRHSYRTPMPFFRTHFSKATLRINHFIASTQKTLPLQENHISISPGFSWWNNLVGTQNWTKLTLLKVLLAYQQSPQTFVCLFNEHRMVQECMKTHLTSLGLQTQ